jgi:hypothetical protein
MKHIKYRQSEACTIKPFMVITVAVSYKARVFATVIHFYPTQIFAGKAEDSTQN